MSKKQLINVHDIGVFNMLALLVALAWFTEDPITLEMLLLVAALYFLICVICYLLPVPYD